jgi:hypothetical protein
MRRRVAVPHREVSAGDRRVLMARHALYQVARERNPRRWSGSTRNWTPVTAVILNPERDMLIQATTSQIRLSGSIGEAAFPPRRRATKEMGGAEPPGATHRAPWRTSMARMASTAPSPQ